MSLLPNNKLIIQLEQYSFIPWDIIAWKISLAFSEPVKLDGLSIALLWINKQENFGINTGSLNYYKSNHYFYNKGVSLLGPGTYESQELIFSLVIPPSILPKRAGSFEKIGNLPPWVITIINILLSFTRMQQPRYIPEFSIVAQADIPWGIDIRESLVISIESKIEENINLPTIFSPEVTRSIEEAQKNIV